MNAEHAGRWVDAASRVFAAIFVSVVFTVGDLWHWARGK